MIPVIMPEEMNIRNARVAAGLTLSRLSQLVNVPKPTLCKHERGRRSLSPARERIVRETLRTELAKHILAAADLLDTLEPTPANPESADPLNLCDGYPSVAL